ncbi:MAG: hypothetical protein JO307_05005 [Bryobacterales bacterium]|nr:hypothetical protein [Bryobacterales bacterium]MBV9401230.1 hypothetical protein [Bryobacterales bacterium]
MPEFLSPKPKLFEELISVDHLAAFNLGQSTSNLCVDEFPAVFLAEVARNQVMVNRFIEKFTRAS